MSERWLVTGGCGFVGANLLRRLVGTGITVRVLDSLVVGRCEDVAGLAEEIVVADIRDAEAVRRAMDGVDVVVHLAAHTRVMDSIESPLENFDINARGTLVLLEAARFNEASQGGVQDWGTHWRLDVAVTRQGKSAVVRTIWIVRAGESVPRFVTCWVL